jgi:tight adherence protein B
MNVVLALAVFIAVLCIIEGGALLLRPAWDTRARRMKEQLTAIAQIEESQAAGITKSRIMSSVPSFNDLLNRLPMMLKLDSLLMQANARYPLGVFLLLALVLALWGVLLLSFLLKSFTLSWVGLCFGLLPFFYAKVKKDRRMKKFEEQLPEALELLARSLRAGHALTGGLQMVAQEFPDPLGTEFGRVLAQISLGVSVEQALRNLTERVDCPDLKFLTVSVLIQRETGGNLAEILDSIGRLIRERFKLKGRIRTLSAEGRLSAIILVLLPMFVALAITVLNPRYISVLGSDPAGKLLVFVALIMMVIGILIIKRLVAIRV